MPENDQNSIFISYRRSDSQDVCDRIFEGLSDNFGKGSTFRDLDSKFGLDFRKVIDDALRKCKVVIVVIGDQWIDVRNKDGGRRLDHPHDHVKIEVETALNLGVPVIPVMVEKASIPKAEDLPEEIKDLERRGGFEFQSGQFFDRSMQILVENLSEKHHIPLRNKDIDYKTEKVEKESQKEEQKPVSQGLNIGVIIASIIIPLIGIILGIIFMRDKNPNKKKVGRIWLYVGIGAFIFWILYQLGSM